jgi:electron transfer flavoprotein-quinone oxidoreductase
MEKFDAIIVGAGLAGLAAAYTLASEGVEVLVLERGDYPGSKNVTGGRIYLNPVRSLFPGLWEDAPL